MKQRYLFLLTLCCACTGMTRAQDKRPFSEDIRFADYLLDQQQYDDARLLLAGMDTTSLNIAQKDTVHYYLGWLYYTRKELELSVSQLLSVSAASGYFLKSQFFGAYNLSYLRREDSATIVLKNIPVPDTFLQKAVNFELAGIALLKRDYPAFDRYSEQFTHTFYATARQENNLDGYAGKLRAIRRKSPLLGGIMSAIIPGSGKMYAGKPMQGLGALLPIAGLGIVTWETYHRKGARDPLFYIFGSAFTVFYVGNIWGSALSVKIARREHEQFIDQQILLDMHIPLRTLFN